MRLEVSSRTRIRMHALIHLSPYDISYLLYCRKSLRARLHRPDPIRNPGSRPTRELDRASPIEATKESTSALHPRHSPHPPPPGRSSDSSFLPSDSIQSPFPAYITSYLTSQFLPAHSSLYARFRQHTCAREIVTSYLMRRFASKPVRRAHQKGRNQVRSFSHISFKVYMRF